MIELETFDLRQLQKEAARALSCMEATNNNLWQFNKKAHHNSQNWYRAVISWYIEEYGGLPSQVGPGRFVKLILDDSEDV